MVDLPRDLSGQTFTDTDLSGARFVEADLSGVVMRGVFLDRADIDGEIRSLRVNGVEVAPLVEAELCRREPRRQLASSTEPDGLRAAWAALEEVWSDAYDRVETMPDGTVETSVDGEWSFAQTLRHLVFATDAWLGHSVLGRERPFHPWGLCYAGYRSRVAALGVDVDATPSYEEVRKIRADRVALVRDFLADLTPERVEAKVGTPPWEPAAELSVLTCLHVILNEEWEHHRFAVRDLDLLDARAPEH